MKCKKEHLKYLLFNKETNEGHIFRFKTKLAQYVGVNVRTLDRNIPYETHKYIIAPIKSVNL